MILPLSILSILPYCQPIVGPDQRSVIGYEILGRYLDHNQSVHSLGSFFHRNTIDSRYKSYVDRSIRTKALEIIKTYADKHKLFFFNISPNFFTDEEDISFYNQLTDLFQMTDVLRPGQIVLEITETDYFINESLFKNKLLKYHNLGCKIAVDDFGRGFSNLDRVALLKPQFLKIDLHKKV